MRRSWITESEGYPWTPLFVDPFAGPGVFNFRQHIDERVGVGERGVSPEAATRATACEGVNQVLGDVRALGLAAGYSGKNRKS